MRPAVPMGRTASEAGPARQAERAARRSVCALGLWALVLVAGAGLTSLYDRSFIGIDGAFFVSAAQNLASGHGFATSIVWSEEHYRLGGMPATQTNFPPGYPLLIALVSRLGIDPPYAAFLVSLLSFAAIPLVVYSILRSTHPPHRAFAVSAVWLGSVFAWFNVLGCMSEMPFVLLTLVSLRCIMQSERDPGRRDWWLAAAGTMAGLAFTVRYQGVYYVISLGLLFLLRLSRQRDRQSARALVLVAGPASVLVLGLFLRNQLLTGKLTGSMIAGDQTVLDVLQTLQEALGAISGFTTSGLLAWGMAEITLIIVAAAGLVGGVCWIGRVRIDRAALRAAVAETHVSISLTYVTLTVILMVQGARNHATGHISPRYLLPLLPFLLLCFADGARLVRFTSSRSWQQRAVGLWRGAAVVALVAGQLNVYDHHWYMLTQANPYRAIRAALERPLAGETVVQFLRERVTTDRPLLGNEAQLLAAVLDRPVLGLPSASFTREEWTADQVRRLVAKYGVAYVVFFPNLFNPANAEDRNRPFFHQLNGGDAPRWLVTILAVPDVRLYRVDHAAVTGSPDERVPARDRT